MNTSAVRHRSTIDMCYAADNDTAVIRLRTGRDIEKAYIIYVMIPSSIGSDEKKNGTAPSTQ